MPAMYDELVRHVNRLERRVDDLVLPEKSPDLVSPFLSLPVLRGLWVASVDSGGDWYDLSGIGKTLTYNGNPTFNYAGLVPYWDYDGVGDYHNRADEADLDILGTESYVAAAARGLTVGGWFWFDNLSRGEYLMAKYQGAANRSFCLRKDAGTDLLEFRIYDAADAADGANSASAVAASQWYHVVGRYDPGAEASIFVNMVESVDSVGIPAALQNSAAAFTVGATAGGGSLLDGRAALCFLCAALLSDAQISSLFCQTRAAFGV